MKKIMTIAAISALAIGGSAMAAQYEQGNIDMRVDRLQADIDAGVSSGTIAPDAARTLHEQLRQLRYTEYQYNLDGLSRDERRDLRDRARNLREQIRYAQRSTPTYGYAQSGWIDTNRDGYDDRDHDRDGRWDDDQRYVSSDRVDRDRDGWDDRDQDRDGRWDDDQRYGSLNHIDRNGDGWDDRDIDRDGRWQDDGYYGQGGPFEEVTQACPSQVGIPGIIGSLFGLDNCLGVGERVNGSLGALPAEYANDFRDGGGYYYRYLDGNVVQIDARTGVVARIYDVD
jgi:hypothetical protein